MEKYYLCSVQSKTNPNKNETILVPIDEISDFVALNLNPDNVILVSYCSTFKFNYNEK